MLEILKSISWSNVASIIFGATISAIVSYALQRNSFAEARRIKEHDRYEVRKAQAYSLFFKMIRIHSTIVLLRKAVSDSISQADGKGLKSASLWQKIQPFGNLPPRVKFTSDEMALLLSLDITLFNEAGPYDDIHNSFLDLCELYGVKRYALMEKFGAKMAGGIGITGLTQAESDWLSPRAFELNGLATVMLQRAQHDAVEAKGILERMHALFVKHFQLNPKLEHKEL
ncbi:MAG: hypothetical protein KGK01_09860 [Bradyrhizobium sp.]|uniref:hypothetical protein n=1 Tax=Bradyrhizobium sp. TaxID=376 RepID=UPI001C289AB5|nr:hypothetical protein [Bradyrhizobium sp.]MBU6464092.1 hypothetical protein [Pseudomonadota bacterium]MDE2069137.1 hypothetical protein [Bradyrhizobium sp.]MDE2242723.1 hypothetical protein [Bradyrhizobium sp.]MDE2467175.1 hypothetical protein [Bradyrhizobium sp.]